MFLPLLSVRQERREDGSTGIVNSSNESMLLSTHCSIGSSIACGSAMCLNDCTFSTSMQQHAAQMKQLSAAVYLNIKTDNMLSLS